MLLPCQHSVMVLRIILIVCEEGGRGGEKLILWNVLSNAVKVQKYTPVKTILTPIIILFSSNCENALERVFCVPATHENKISQKTVKFHVPLSPYIAYLVPVPLVGDQRSKFTSNDYISHFLSLYWSLFQYSGVRQTYILHHPWREREREGGIEGKGCGYVEAIKIQT